MTNSRAQSQETFAQRSANNDPAAQRVPQLRKEFLWKAPQMSPDFAEFLYI